MMPTVEQEALVPLPGTPSSVRRGGPLVCGSAGAGAGDGRRERVHEPASVVLVSRGGTFQTKR